MLEHFRRPGRPGEVWFALCLIHRQRDLPEEVIREIHRVVGSLPGEREGRLAFDDRKEREKASRKGANAEPLVRKWELLGFKSLLEFLDHVKVEQCYADASDAQKQPEWVQFGFRSEKAFRKAVRRMT